MDKYPERKPNRLREYDYSQSGYYYVTICVQNRRFIFGDISNNKMITSQYGDIAKNSWLDLPNHYKNIQLDVFVIMPNHIHGIIIINNPVGNRPACSVNKNNNLSVIVGSYKSTVTKQINRMNNVVFRWQKSFHDHIIRTTDSLKNIREYIENNPINWNNDENNPVNYKVTVQAGLNPIV
ncbi:MAG: transposase [Candidatus Omnitrophota bacterium]